MVIEVSRLRRGALATMAMLVPALAHGQASTRRIEAPTDGLALPTTPLAGEHDARAIVANPGGLALVRGSELTLALDLEQEDVAAAAGQGFGDDALVDAHQHRRLQPRGVGSDELIYIRALELTAGDPDHRIEAF